MRNLFEGAYFGKAYKTKDNTRVIFVQQRYENDFSIYIPKCKYSIETIHRYNSKGEFYLGNGEHGHAALDIISEWQEPIDEDKLEELAYEYIIDSTHQDDEEEIYISLKDKDVIKGFKAGYRKAKEE